MSEILEAPIEEFNLPPEVLNTYQKKNYDFIRYTIKKYGQQMPVAATKADDKLDIVDGQIRFLVCQELNIKTLKYFLVDDIPDVSIIQKKNDT